MSVSAAVACLPDRIDCRSASCGGTPGVTTSWFGDVALDGIDENEFLAARTLVIEPAPFKGAFFAEVVHLLDRAGHQFRGIGDADPRGRTPHAQADFAIDRRGEHLEEPRLLKYRFGGLRRLPVPCLLEGAAHESSGRVPGVADWNLRGAFLFRFRLEFAAGLWLGWHSTNANTLYVPMAHPNIGKR